VKLGGPRKATAEQGEDRRMLSLIGYILHRAGVQCVAMLGDRFFESARFLQWHQAETGGGTW